MGTLQNTSLAKRYIIGVLQCFFYFNKYYGKGHLSKCILLFVFVGNLLIQLELFEDLNTFFEVKKKNLLHNSIDQ